MKKDFILQYIERRAAEPRYKRSAWGRGVIEYARELVADRSREEWPESPDELERALLNGADDWSAFSWGGCSLICNEDVAERLCSPSELKRTNGGRWRPNHREEWLDTQARALFQACCLIKHALHPDG